MAESLGVYKAIAGVAADMAKEGVAKTRTNQQQGYKFRGIDEVMNALAPMMVKHGLLMLPRVLSRTVAERRSGADKPLFYVVVESEYDFVAVSDGSKHTVKVFGEAMDSADKATNKAEACAFKYAAFQSFCIPTEGDGDADADAHTHEPKAAGDGDRETGRARVASTPAAPVCPKCGGPMVERNGKQGKFYGCKAYPKCRGTAPHSNETSASGGAGSPSEAASPAPGAHPPAADLDAHMGDAGSAKRKCPFCFSEDVGCGPAPYTYKCHMCNKGWNEAPNKA